MSQTGQLTKLPRPSDVEPPQYLSLILSSLPPLSMLGWEKILKMLGSSPGKTEEQSLGNSSMLHSRMCILSYSVIFIHQPINPKENRNHCLLSILVQEEERGLEREVVVPEHLLCAKHHTVSTLVKTFQIRIFNPHFSDRETASEGGN